MSDARVPPECAEVLRLLEAHPLSAHEMAALLRCSIKQVLERVHLCWFSIVPVTGDWPGWKYAPRQSLPKSAVKPVERVAEYDNTGISMKTVNYG